METKKFLQFENIINVLASSFRFISIPMLWVYDHYKCLILSVLVVRNWRLQALDSKNVRLWRLQVDARDKKKS